MGFYFAMVWKGLLSSDDVEKGFYFVMIKKEVPFFCDDVERFLF
jgi:hypothetical protein